jgi:hypothetical protein
MPTTSLSRRSRSATAKRARISSGVAWWAVNHPNFCQSLKLTWLPDQKQPGMLQYVRQEVMALPKTLGEFG